MVDVIVVGAGVVGLAIARELAPRRSVLVLDKSAPGAGATFAAAGMLSPQSEADEPGPFYHLCQASLRMYPKWIQAVRRQTGIDPELSPSGLLVLANTSASMEVLRRRHDWQRRAGLQARLLTPVQVAKLEPNITLDVAGGLLFPSDHHVLPRRLTEALRQACLQHRVEIRPGVHVEAVVEEDGRVAGVRAGGEVLKAPNVVIAGGAWSGFIDGTSARTAYIPRKGQILSVTMPGAHFHHMIRWEHCYFIPRRNGELVIGATEEDAGFESSVTPAGISQILNEAQRISNDVRHFPIREMWSGIRPATRDGLPVIGRGAARGLFYATGHYRNGVLLAPVTAAIVHALISGRRSPVLLDAFAPGRFR